MSSFSQSWIDTPVIMSVQHKPWVCLGRQADIFVLEGDQALLPLCVRPKRTSRSHSLWRQSPDPALPTRVHEQKKSMPEMLLT